MTSGIKLKFAYDAVHPEDDERIKQLDDAHFEVNMAPEAGRQDLRFDVRFENGTGETRECRLDIVWRDERWAVYCDHLFTRGPRCRDWRMVSSTTNGDRTATMLTLAPGKTLVAFCPMYTCRDCLRFTDRLAARDDPRISVSACGQSRERREIPMVTISRGAATSDCLVVSRCHGCETALKALVHTGMHLRKHRLLAAMK